MAFNQGLQTASKMKHIPLRFLTQTKNHTRKQQNLRKKVSRPEPGHNRRRIPAILQVPQVCRAQMSTKL